MGSWLDMSYRTLINVYYSASETTFKIKLLSNYFIILHYIILLLRQGTFVFLFTFTAGLFKMDYWKKCLKWC